MATAPARIALTPGAENGVGPELLLMALSSLQFERDLEFFWCGDEASLMLASKRSGIHTKIDQEKAALDSGLILNFFPPIAATNTHERQARFLDLSVTLAKTNKIDAIVTGPIEKAALAFVDQGPFAGQTEYFAAHLPSTDTTPFMAFLGGPFMLSLLTTHLPLRNVADAINEAMIVKHMHSVAKNCARLIHKAESEVRIAILGLNPHAGEGGLLGQEEIKIYETAIKRAKNSGLNVVGPLPADGFFAYQAQSKDRPDAVIASYHDQALPAYKILSHQSAVNITFGLSHVRVSPAHGTATDLVGKKLANGESTKKAIEMAVRLV